ncbi:expressed unknown protein [Seminavis robusta]|uniref:Uncharacterized protein n=1 Tax=Seminavis robusta TaxID=568900 RepID=A0A9N8HML5_9STRA|nr:expressed unknown protein [Seminavis robusta]|eukprot:Sro909_g219000.1 n/a (841) ;mRNA; r:24244-26766
MRRHNPYQTLVSLILLFVWIPGVSSLYTGGTRGGGHHKNQEDDRPNMNGDYVLSSTPHANNTQKLFPTHFKDYPDIATESFDVYSPIISQLYSQVFWKGLPPVKLPQHIASKYKGQVMAVIGFELDQVRIDKDGKERSVPMNAVYNHHFEATMIGGDKTTRFELVSPKDSRIVAQQQRRQRMGHGIPPHQPYWLVVDTTTESDMTSTGGEKREQQSMIPTQQAFTGANGGEVRKSFHGYPPGFAQLIASPKAIQITPMQIDTWNRDAMDLDNNFTRFVPGPLPRNSLAPKNKNVTYSGLLECPVTTRIQKHLPPQGYLPLAKGSCENLVITSPDDCFQAVTKMVRESDNQTQIHTVSGQDDPSRPKGCSMRVVSVPPIPDYDDEQRVIEAFYNNASETTVECGSRNADQLYSAAANSLVEVSVMIDTAKDLVTISLKGPAYRWFGVGFGARKMKDQPWTIVVEGGQGGAVTERKLEDHAGGTLITPSTITVKSSTTCQDGTKTVIVTRPIQGQYFNFDAHVNNTATIDFINAVGSSKQFGYHENKAASSMLVLPVTTARDDNNNMGGVCMCQKDPPPFGAATGGSLEYHPVKGQPGERGVAGSVQLDNKCEPYPHTDLLEQKNPTCDIRTYVGGQTACHHMWSLLDADQDIPWADQPLEYRLKFRFWVQPYDASYHTNVHMTRHGIGSPVEYDVPKCEDGIPGCSLEVDHKTNRERWVHTIRGTIHVEGRIVAAHFHCHAPTCIMMAMYLCDDDNDERPCDETSATLLCEEHAVRQHGEPGQRFNEPDFIYQPPCLFGSSKYGLEPPIEMTGRTLFVKKTADATYGHHGEMAWAQMAMAK